MKSKPEAEILRDIMQHVSKTGGRAFRNTGGLLYTLDGRPVRVGMGTGTADLIGWYPYRIQHTDIDREIAVFLAIECKTERGRATQEQANFIRKVADSGGIACIAREPADVATALYKYTFFKSSL